MRVLVIDENVKKKIKDLVDYSFQDIVTFEEVQKTISGEVQPVVNDGSHVLPVNGFRVVFSIEEQLEKNARHISISVDGDNYPSVEAVNMLLEEFGYKEKISKEPNGLYIWLEENERAINVVELIH